MTETSAKILESYQVRKTKEQKSAFREYIKTVAEDMGYSARVEDGSLGAKNLVIGSPENAKVVFTAHYDTPPVMPLPNFITPKSIPVYVLYQIFVVAVLMILPALAVGFAAYFIMTALAVGFAAYFIMTGMSMGGETAGRIAYFVGYFFGIAVVLFVLLGPANKHNANDNTSGVTTIVDIMRDLPTDLRDSAAFVLFDLEESGLLGSASFYKQHKDFMKDKLLINFDCVGEGENMLFVLKKGAVEYESLIKEAYLSTEKFKVEILTRGYVYPSDQASFPVGVGACALNSTKQGLLYMNKIHTARDIVYMEENIEFFKNGSIKLTGIISEK